MKTLTTLLRSLCLLLPLSNAACVGSEDATEDDLTLAQDTRMQMGDAASGTPDNICHNTGADATSRCASPDHTAAYYLDQASAYFSSLDPAHNKARPTYDTNVLRYEWAPWWGDDGWGKQNTGSLDWFLRFKPATVNTLKCRFFDKAPYARCYVNLSYSDGNVCPIYEEFSSLPGGKMSFVEAWTATKSDSQGPFMPQGDARLMSDLWGEQDATTYRTSTKYPGLGSSSGLGGASKSAKSSVTDKAVKKTLSDISSLARFDALLLLKQKDQSAWGRACSNTKTGGGNKQEAWDKSNGWFYTGECLRYFTNRSDQPMSASDAQNQCRVISASKAANALQCFDDKIWSHGASYPSAATAQGYLEECLRP
jgi:hypothetical protein